MQQLIWIMAHFIFKQLQLPLTLAFTLKKDCVFAPVNEILSRRHIGPKITGSYNPHPGYEPYWPGGDWVFERFDITTEKPEGSICGEVCPELYIEFGEVCGRNLYYFHKTFSNYCSLLDEDCKGRDKWLIAYRGECQDNFKTYPSNDQMITRAEGYLSNFSEKFPFKYMKG